MTDDICMAHDKEIICSCGAEFQMYNRRQGEISALEFLAKDDSTSLSSMIMFMKSLNYSISEHDAELQGCPQKGRISWMFAEEFCLRG